jgi:hypothetical protein
VQCFEIDEKAGTIKLKEGVYEQFDENGNATVVSFSYGASGAM